MQTIREDKIEVAALYKQFHEILFNYIKNKVNNYHDAQDILQNVFIKVAYGINDLSRKEKLQSWMYTIARNAIIDYYRARSSKKESSTETEELLEYFSEEEYSDISKDLDCCLMGFVAQLPEEYRDIIIDVDLRGIKQKDLTVKYELAYPSVRSRVQRGREKLKQLLLDCCNMQWDKRGNILAVDSRTCSTDNISCEK